MEQDYYDEFTVLWIGGGSGIKESLANTINLKLQAQDPDVLDYSVYVETNKLLVRINIF